MSSPPPHSTRPHAGPRGETLRRVAGPAAVVLVAGYMLQLSWLKWPDAIIDFGKELYMPWQIVRGAVLFRDLDSYLGPLSPHVNALWYLLFGVSLRTLVLCNLALLAVLAMLLYRLLLLVADRLAAAVAMAVFFVVCAFSHFSGYGNYNLVTPYTHEASHGTLLGVVALSLFSLYLWAPRRAWLAGAGLAVGLASLGRPEPCLAAGAAVLGGLVLHDWMRGVRVRATTLSIAVLVGAMALPSALAWALFARVLPPGLAASGVFRGWRAALNPELTGLPFFREGMGLDAPLENLASMLTWTAIWAAAFLPAAALAFAAARVERFRALVVPGCFLLGVLLTGWTLASAGPPRLWLEAVRPLPVAIGLLAVITLGRLVRDHARGGYDPRLVLIAALSVFAMGMLGKVLLHPRLHHVGYINTMPAVLLVVLALVGWVPRAIDRSGGRGAAFAAAALALILVWVGNVHRVTVRAYAGKTVWVGEGADRFLADRRGEAVQAAVNEIRERVAPHQTLAVLPEGAMLNFLARRSSSTPYPIIMGTEVATFGEERMLEGFRRAPPDFLILAHKDTSEFGARFFGRDYATSFAPWIAENYRPVWRVGAAPLVDDRFGLLMLERAP